MIFCILILYPITLLNYLTIYSHGLYGNIVIFSANKKFYSFQVLQSNVVIVLANTFNTRKQYGESGLIFLFLSLREYLQYFHISFGMCIYNTHYIYTYLHMYTLYVLEVYICIYACIHSINLYFIKCWILSNAFLTSMSLSIWIFSVNDCFLILNHSRIPGINSTWS